MILLVLRRFVTKNGGLHDNLISFDLLSRPMPYTLGPVGGRLYLSLNLNFTGNYPWECLKKNLDNEGVSINYPIFRKKRYRGPGRPGHELVSRPSHTGI